MHARLSPARNETALRCSFHLSSGGMQISTALAGRRRGAAFGVPRAGGRLPSRGGKGGDASIGSRRGDRPVDSVS